MSPTKGIAHFSDQGFEIRPVLHDEHCKAELVQRCQDYEVAEFCKKQILQNQEKAEKWDNFSNYIHDIPIDEIPWKDDDDGYLDFTKIFNAVSIVERLKKLIERDDFARLVHKTELQKILEGKDG